MNLIYWLWSSDMPLYVVQKGDCLSSIAFGFGFLPDTLLNHPANAGLKQKRKDPNILLTETS